MGSRSVAPLAVLALTALSTIGPRTGAGRKPAAPAELVVATFNVENLFDPYDDPYRPDEGTPPKSYWELRDLVRAIDRIGADVLGLQEVENLGILGRLNGALEQPYPFIEALPTNDRRGIRCALLSRFPIRSATCRRWRDLTDELKPARDFPSFSLDTGAGVLEVFVVHLKSHRGRPGDPESRAWRAAEAAALAKAVEEVPRERPVLVLGDFNDGPEAETLAPLFSSLGDAGTFAPEKERYSYVFRGARLRIDHVLYRGLPDPLRASFGGVPHRASDHRWLRAVFQVRGSLRRAAPGARRPLAEPFRPVVAVDDLAALRRNLLHEVEVRGRLVRVAPTRRGAHLRLLFDEKGRPGFIGFVPVWAKSRFTGLQEAGGKMVALKGPVYRYRGTLEIQLTHAEQFTVLHQ